MAPTTTKVLSDKTKQLEKSLNELVKNRVYVGVPSTKADRKRQKGDTANNAEIGYWMEFGVPEKNIPARPFLLPGIRNAQDKIVGYLKNAGKGALDNKQDVVESSFKAAGLTGQIAVQLKITDGPFAPLSDRTIAARKKRGRTSERPLIDTGQLRRAITYVIRERK